MDHEVISEQVEHFKRHGELLHRELDRAVSRGRMIKKLDHPKVASEVIAKAQAVYHSIANAVNAGQGMMQYAGRFVDSPVQRVMVSLGVSDLAGLIAYDAVMTVLNQYLNRLVQDVAAVNVLLDESEEEYE